MSRTWTFGQKLGAGFAVVVTLTLIMAGVSYYSLGAVTKLKNRVIQQTGQDLIDAERLRAAMQREVAAFRAFLLSGEERHANAIRAANRQFAVILENTRTRGQTSAGERLLAAIGAAEAAHQEKVNELMARRRSEGADLAAIGAAFDRDATPRFVELSERVREYVDQSEQDRLEARRRAESVTATANSVILLVGLITLILAALIALFLTRALSRQIGSSVQHIRSSSAELQAAATQQASGAKEQASAMNEITTTIGELLATSRQIADSGQHVAKIASDTSQGAKDGELAVAKAQQAVESIRQQVDTIVQHMLDLGKKSQQVGGILEIINELSEQTNILAINATIEASGAGEAGRRFLVVGEEIRKLADRVGGSTKEIRVLIDEIRAAVNATVMATETGSKTVEAGTQRFEELTTAFTRIGDLVVSTTEAGREIELSTKQQSTAVEQVNVAISNVAQATRETEASSGQTLQTASQLATLSDELGRLVQAQSS